MQYAVCLKWWYANKIILPCVLFFMNIKPSRDPDALGKIHLQQKKNITHRRQSKKSYLLKEFVTFLFLFEDTSQQR
jgi:hypothetical protein